TQGERVENLVGMLDGYFAKNGHHMNVNVFNRDTLVHAMEHPELYPQLTIRVSGYAVNFIKLTREQQLDVISRTFHVSH
ncbi:MAG TPA: glycine radical domain-containing protein, partial [Azonexus sp.]|nr:glycine radical domain-containing protein [Azonexus sp.]